MPNKYNDKIITIFGNKAQEPRNTWAIVLKESPTNRIHPKAGPSPPC